jgi:long-subunit fatty acid transport protein
MLRQFIKGMNSSLLGPVVGAILGLPQSIPEVQSGNMVATIPFPERMQIGVKVKPVDFLQLNMDVSYTNWAKWNSLTFKFDQDIALLQMAHLFGIANSTQLTMPMGFTNVVNVGFGVQAQVTKKIALRAGYEPRKSSIPADKISVLTPLPDTVMKSVGLQYKLDDGGEINLAASYMTGSYNVPARTDCNLNCDNFFNIVYNPYAATNVAGDITIRYVGINYTRPF